MNLSIIRYILGHVLKIEALLMMLPCVVAVIYQETEGLAFLSIAVLTYIFSILLRSRKPENTVFYLKEGCVATALSWIMMSFFGCLPFILTGEIPSFIDAMFETISGFTTTGSSILNDVEALSSTSLFWRSFTHWIGGMGVLVFVLAVVPLSGGSNMNLMKAESPGPSVGKLVPKVRATASMLYKIYFTLTIIQIILLIIGKMPVFDSIVTAFGTAGTGGFGIKNDSITSYSPYLQWVVTIFMFLFGINFNFYYLILFREFRKAFSMEEVKCYFFIVIGSIAIIFVNILPFYKSTGKSLLHAAFQVSSIITTTGFVTTDFNLWPEICRSLLILLMFIGACAGSTGGGIKVSRIILLFKSFLREFHSYAHPKSVKKVSLDGKPVDYEILRTTYVYLAVFLCVFVTSILLLSLDGNDFITNFTAVAATLNNIGPGLELVGATKNFGHFSVLSKCVLSFDMLAGRLELFPLLMLFYPKLWKDSVNSRLSRKKRKTTM